MKWLAIALLFFTNTALFAKHSKPTFRVLIACDMTSKDIRKGSKADLVRMKKSCIGIARQLHITPKITTLSGKKFTTKNVSKWLTSIPSLSKDIIFFYYSGHGGNLTSLKNPWPFMIFPLYRHPRKAKAIVGGSVYQYLLTMKPRLCLIMFDACNNFFQTKGAGVPSGRFTPIITPTPVLPGLKTLFLQNRGIITSCAASPGETAVTTVGGNTIGGVFTTGFLLALQSVAAQQNATWQNIFAGAATYCLLYNNGNQHPIYTIQTTVRPTQKSTINKGSICSGI